MGKKGAIGFVPPEGHGALCTSHFFLFEIRNEKLDPKYMQAIFTANYLQPQLDAEAKGTTGYAAVRPKNLLATEIPLPPLEEQRRIVARIEELAAKIEGARGLRREAVEAMELLSGSAARALFADCDGVNSLPLQELVTVRGGGTPSKSNPFFWQGTIPWVSPKDMKAREISNTIDHISEEATKETSAKLIDQGTVVIVTRGMILAHTVPSAILRVPATINQDMKALVPGKKLLPEYLCNTLWALNHELLDLIEKSTHDTRKLETTKLMKFKIPLPSVPEQRRIVAYLDDLQSKVEALKQLQAETQVELDSLLPSILDKAFKGELV